MDRPYAQLVRDALDVLDRYRAPIGKRDPVKSLDEDREELLGRVRAALERLISPAPSGRDNVIEIVRRIDEFLRGQVAQDTLEQAALVGDDGVTGTRQKPGRAGNRNSRPLRDPADREL